MNNKKLFKKEKLRQDIFSLCAMFPQLSVDTVTAAMLQHDGAFDKALNCLLAEMSRVTECVAPIKPLKQTNEPVQVVDALLNEKELQALREADAEKVQNGALDVSINASASASTSTNSLENINEKTNVDTIKARQRYRRYELLVVQLAETFSHVPLDDV